MIETTKIVIRLGDVDLQSIRTFWAENSPIPIAGDRVIIRDEYYRVIARIFHFKERELEVVLNVEKQS